MGPVGAGKPALYNPLACNPAPWLPQRRQAGAYRTW